VHGSVQTIMCLGLKFLAFNKPSIGYRTAFRAMVPGRRWRLARPRPKVDLSSD
jgi:hypothetical protein